jgi:short-subunit dehydrogenase
VAKQPLALGGKTALVTGATGGVGKALAHALTRDGVIVAMADLDQAKLDAAVIEVGGGAVGAALDVSDLAAYSRYIDEVERQLGPLDILCNVAAIMPIGPFDAQPDSTTARIVDINLTAVIHSTKDVARRMKARGAGHIVNVASGAGWLAGGGGATYCATKFGVVGYSESVALELRGTGVEISVIAPSVIKSEMSVGLKHVRGVRAVDTAEVADAIVHTLKYPRFATFVPKAMGVMSMGFAAIPYRARHFLARLVKTDKLLLEADQTARAEYEARIAVGAD